MLQIDIITIFPNMFDSYLKESILARALKQKKVRIRIHNLRDYARDKRKTVDDKPYGGGPGMILMIEPIYKAVKKIGTKKRRKIVLLSAKGKKFNQAMAKKFSTFNQLILICGRYEGVDERVARYLADYEISIGDYILTGGELPAMVLVDAITRLLPGVLGNKESLKEESFGLMRKGLSNKEKLIKTKEYPHYTRPEVFSPNKRVKWKVPKILLSGNHEKIQEWRVRQSANKGF